MSCIWQTWWLKQCTLLLALCQQPGSTAYGKQGRMMHSVSVPACSSFSAGCCSLGPPTVSLPLPRGARGSAQTSSGLAKCSKGSAKLADRTVRRSILTCVPSPAGKRRFVHVITDACLDSLTCADVQQLRRWVPQKIGWLDAQKGAGKHIGHRVCDIQRCVARSSIVNKPACAHDLLDHGHTPDGFLVQVVICCSLSFGCYALPQCSAPAASQHSSQLQSVSFRRSTFQYYKFVCAETTLTRGHSKCSTRHTHHLSCRPDR